MSYTDDSCFLIYQPDLRLCPRINFDKQGKLSTSCQTSYEAVLLKICPEIGLAKQNFKCNECNSNIVLASSNICDYDGKYYCTNKCHTSDTSVIPARIIHNWDFTPRFVSKRSLLLINFIRSRPILFNVLQLNSMLYGFVDELPALKVRIYRNFSLEPQYNYIFIPENTKRTHFDGSIYSPL